MHTSPGRPNYQHHAGFYRSINPGHDLSKPWESSPESARSLPMSPFRPVFELPKSPPDVGNNNNSLSSTSTVVVASPADKKGLWRRIFWFLNSGQNPRKGDALEPLAKIHEPPNPYSEKVPLHEWKQYGYWARPFINDVLCQNSPVTSEKTIGTEALADLVTNMRGIEDPDFDLFPERWIVGAKHRALPQRPARWKDPDPALPLPFPWEVQLNPFLHHLLWGPSPLRWCIWDDPYVLLRYGRTSFNVHCTDPDRAQPATWPFLTCMHFNAVQGDDAYHFPWPFTVYNPKGLKVGDVLAEIHYNFSLAITEGEFSSWPTYRQKAARQCLKQRQNRYSDYDEPPSTDYLRRWDALGAKMFFRGIEPTVDGGGWMIVFGPY